MSVSRYVVFSLLGIAVAILGFNVTYIQPVVFGARELPAIYHWHGFFGAAWLLLFLAQTTFIASGRRSVHKRVGILGAFVAAGVAATMPLVAFAEVQKQIAAGSGAVDNTLGPFLDAITFGALVGLGLATRRRIAAHKRWLLLATILLLWVAWARLRYYFPPFPGNFDFFAFVIGMAPIPIFWWLEWRESRRVHSVLLFGGLGVLLEQGLQLALYGGDLWSAAAQTLYSLMDTL